MNNNITTGVHRNGRHWAKAFDLQGTGDTPKQAREDLQYQLRRKADEMEELALSMLMEAEE